MRSLKFQTRLLLAFGSLIGLYALIGLIVLTHLAQIRGDASELDVTLAHSRHISEWAGLTRLNLERTLALAHAGPSSTMGDYLKPRMRQTTARINELQQGIDREAQDQERDLLQTVRLKRKQYVDLRTALLDGPPDAIRSQRIDSELVPAAAAYLDSISSVDAWVGHSGEARMASLQSTMDRSRAMVILSIFTGLLLGVALTYLTGREVLRCLGGDPREVKRIAEMVANGRLHLEDVPVVRPEHADSLLATMLRMSEALKILVTGVRASAEAVESACAQIEAGNQDLASRTAQQASFIEQTNELVSTLAEQLGQTMEGAEHADRNAHSASVAAAQGGMVVAEVVKSMDEIHGSSKKIADIISVIDGIAFQTNILALNAAVEAARAGDQGRGFAVVASEVRSLAQRSATAAKEIKSLIGNSVSCVENGNCAAQDAGETMKQVVQGIQQVSDIVAQMRTSGREQVGATTQVHQTMQRLNDFAQQNSALVEESAAAAGHLLDQARHLVTSVGIFALA